MYTLRGADNKEHGPLAARDVREWIATGQANRSTLARAEGEAKWRPLSDFIEFAAALETAGTPGALAAEDRPKTYRVLAICSLVMSVLGICFLPGIILGIVTLILTYKRPRQFGGRGLAIAAIVIGLLWPIGAGTASYFMFTKARQSYYRGQNCPMHVRSLVQSIRVISYANNGTYPNADSWCDAIRKEVTSTNHYQCPEDPQHAVCGYAYNAKLSGVKDPNPNTVVIFEADLGWNGSGGMSNVVERPRHHFGGIPFVQPARDFIFVGLANGAIRPVGTNEIRQLRWNP